MPINDFDFCGLTEIYRSLNDDTLTDYEDGVGNENENITVAINDRAVASRVLTKRRLLKAVRSLFTLEI